ncbi:MetQ/NlpA family ABC transporter substrate-binding protein [Ureibacillus composti]|nr:MetQ/NlpA family ABC transporter substrate-binding protein [Ureibacillus composti]
MKKHLLIAISIFTFILLAACSNTETTTTASTSTDSKEEQEVTVLKVGASSVPHAEVLEYLAPDLEKDGVKLEIITGNDGIQTNQLTAEGELDFNYFQHVPYMEQINKEAGLNLVNVAGIHIEPFGVYSKTITDINDLPQGAKVAVPKDVVNFSRALLLFDENGIIKLDPNKEGDFTVEDIVENDKELEFIAVDAALLNRSLDDVDVAAINTNYSLEGGFNPLEDALIIEDANSPYVNIISALPERKDDEAIQTVVKWLTSEKAKEFFESEYEGAVVPVF